MPELPVEIPQGAALTMIEWPRLECSMLRFGVRCNNLSLTAIIYPTKIGHEMIAICQSCFDGLSTDWKQAIEQVATGDLYTVPKT
jgi:hypothetical protein